MPHTLAISYRKAALGSPSARALVRATREAVLSYAKNPRARLAQRMRSHGFFAAHHALHGGTP